MIRFLSWFLIPLLTVLVPGREGYLTSNFSVAASEGPARYVLMLWAALTGGFFRLLIRRTAAAMEPLLPARQGRGQEPASSARKSREPLLADLAAACLFLSVLIPYRPEESRPLAALHVFLAFFASALFYCILLLLDLRLYFSGQAGFSGLTGLLLFAGFASAALFLLADFMISSALEIFFTIFSCLWLSAFYRRVHSLPPQS